MANSIYQINKGINKSIVFRGLKAQYIWYMGGSMFLLLVLYAILYMLKVNTYLCLGIICCLGTILMTGIYHLSSIYGEHGLIKALARRSIPKLIKSGSRKTFFRKKHHYSGQNKIY